jgi:quercetin dioxygenase-like cupin family protein
VALTISWGETISWAQPSIETKTVLEAQVDQLPGGSACWDVRRGSLAPGAASPAAGYHTHGLVATYVLDGTERIEYEDGHSAVVSAGEAALISDGVAHRHESVGATPRTNLNFELTCERQANSLGNTGPLPGVNGDLGSHRIQVRERQWPAGAQTPIHVISGPTSTYVLAGAIQRDSASAGIACSQAGELYVSPVGELAQNSNVGSEMARTVDLDIWPAGEIRTAPQPAEVRVWHKSPEVGVAAACPPGE